MQERIAGFCVALEEAGISLNPQLIRSGEFRADSGERLTEQMLSAGLAPSAIITANNEIALGAIAALARHGLRVPHDVALACFGDSNETYFAFLTCIVEPAYEMGTHAVQLLFSRLEQHAETPPREVVLPTRLVIRYSCGSRLKQDGQASPWLVVPPEIPARNILVKAFTAVEREAHMASIADMLAPDSRRVQGTSRRDIPDVSRLLDALAGRPTDRLPHLEFWFESRALYEHILERKLPADAIDASSGEPSTMPEDDVELARCLGMDAVTCHFSWTLPAGSVRGWADLDRLARPPSLADQLGRLARYLDAARGTGVGVIAGFGSPFGTALRAVSVTNDTNILLGVERSLVETLLDIVLEHQARVLQAVCDRFAADLTLVMVRDTVAPYASQLLEAGLLAEMYVARLRRLIAPAKEHGKLVVLHPGGRVDDFLPVLHEAGIDAVHVADTPVPQIVDLKRRWSGKLALIGGFPLEVLLGGDQAQIAEQVEDLIAALASGGGYVLGASGPVTDAVPPEKYVALVQAVHRCGG